MTASGQNFFATVRLVTLTWTGATSQYMTLYRDGVNIGAAANTGTFLDVVVTSGGTFVYKVCEYNTTVARTPRRSPSEPNQAADGAGPYNRGQRR